MSAALLLLLAQVVDDHALIAQLYHDACTEGQVRLRKDQVEVLERDPSPYPPGRGMGVGLPVERTSFLKINRPANTYLTMITYRPVSRSRLASTCTVATRALTRDEALAAFLSTSPGATPRREMYYDNRWTIDASRLGYVKRFSFEGDRWATFTTETFRTATRH